MNKLLYNTINQQILPYPRQDNEPVVGLAPEFAVLTKIDTEPPEYDSDTQQISSDYVVDLGALEYRQVWSVSDLPESTPIPNWDGLYTALLDSTVYQYLVGLSLQFTPVNSALDKVVAAINYGDKKPDSEIAYDAFQSAVNLLLYAMGLVEQSLSVEHIAEIRSALNANGFTGITLG